MDVIGTRLPNIYLMTVSLPLMGAGRQWVNFNF